LSDRHQRKVFHQGMVLHQCKVQMAVPLWSGVVDHARLPFAQHHRGQEEIGGGQGSQSHYHFRMALDCRHEDVGHQQDGHGTSTQIRRGFRREVLWNNQIRGGIGPEGLKETGGVHDWVGPIEMVIRRPKDVNDLMNRRRLAVAVQVDGVVGWLPLTRVAYRT
jgi:hypothetical protein